MFEKLKIILIVLFFAMPSFADDGAENVKELEEYLNSVKTPISDEEIIKSILNAEKPVDKSDTSNTSDTVKKIEKYLNNLTTFTADFIQIDATGGLSDGKFYLSRPGKFRWEYNPPVPIVITAKSGMVNYYDTELKQANHVFLRSTPAGILADENISIEKESINEIIQQFGTTSISMKDKDEERNLTLIFSDEPMLLEGILIEDSTGQKTNILFNNQKIGMELKNALFIPLNPHEYNQPNRR